MRSDTWLFYTWLSVFLLVGGCVTPELWVAGETGPSTRAPSSSPHPAPPAPSAADSSAIEARGNQGSVETGEVGFDSSSVAYRVLLIGDAGDPNLSGPNPALDLLGRRARAAGDSAAVVFLGDNLYGGGMPDSLDPSRPRQEAKIHRQVEALKGFGGRILFIPGNHDWGRPPSEGLLRLERQEQFVESLLGERGGFLPDAGQPGPIEVRLTEEISLVILDTPWWFVDPAERRAAGSPSDLGEEGRVLVELEHLLRQRRDERVLVVGHHPLRSNGRHAGYFPARTHLFPLTEVVPWAYLPLPGLGSLGPLYVRYVGGSQDMASAAYRRLVSGLGGLLAQHEDVVYASGHAHSLQYFRMRGWHQVISGAGSRPRPPATRHGASFTYGREGLIELLYLRDGSVWLEARAPGLDRELDENRDPSQNTSQDESQNERQNANRSPHPNENQSAGRLLYRTRLEPPDPEAALAAERSDAANGTEDAEAPSEPATSGARSFPDSVRTAANPAYRTGPFGRFFLGSHRRAAWAQPVRAPVFRMDTTRGGVQPVRLGGTAQTYNLRLRDSTGREYHLRGLDKDPARTLPPAFRETFFVDARRDQISAMHPYGAFLAAPLAEAAGLYHTNPKLYYVPDDPALGPFRELFAGRLALFEDRPDEDLRSFPRYGRAEEAVSYRTLYRKVDADNDHRVDQRAVARARLFDMLIADWDRHPDQWRWAVFEPSDEPGGVYRPIPRDRDYAFFRANGLIPGFGKRFVLPEYQDFRPTYGDLKGLTQTGLSQTRRFTSELTRADWLRIADSIRTALSDSVIEATVARWERTYEVPDAGEIERILRIRRDRLPALADRYYELSSRVVDVVGSHKHERFEVERRADGHVWVRGYKTKKDGEVVKGIYERLFDPAETEEIRIFGQDGRDRIIVRRSAEAGGRGDGARAEREGAATPPIRLVAIGGPGSDLLADSTGFPGEGADAGSTPFGATRSSERDGKTVFYDTPEGNTWVTGPSTRVRKSRDPAKNRYDPGATAYDRTSPLAELGYNVDEGLVLGAGWATVRHGLFERPYAARHAARARVGLATGGIRLGYEGSFPDLFGEVDGGLAARYRSPNSVRNFYGLGNETGRGDEQVGFYRAELTQATLRPELRYQRGEGLELYGAGVVSVTEVGSDSTRFVGDPQAGIAPATQDDHLLAGMEVGAELAHVDEPGHPRQGYRWKGEAQLVQGLPRSIGRFGRLRTELAVYVSPSLSPQVTLAFRVGGSRLMGEFPFYEASTLGGASNLRGYRSTRFAGRTSLFQNLEVRAQLFTVNSYLAWGRAGALAFVDQGRVWTDGERSDRWHRGAGAGLWFELYDRIVLVGWGAVSPESVTATVRVGFFF